MDGNNLNKSASDNSEKTSDDHKKKVMHRDSEKLRRQEMSNLLLSLRSLLPLEYIKGKRSMHDYMNEAVNYVKDLKNRINELSFKRDELKRLQDSSVLTPDCGSSSGNYVPNQVIVHPCLGGLEVVISCGLREQSFPLSSLLEVLLQEGLDVVNCVFTKANQTLHLTVRTQVINLTCINLSGLQQKLTEVIA